MHITVQKLTLIIYWYIFSVFVPPCDFVYCDLVSVTFPLHSTSHGPKHPIDFVYQLLKVHKHGNLVSLLIFIYTHLHDAVNY